MSNTLMDYILELLHGGAARAAFEANPQQALSDAGLSGVCAQDVSDAVSYVSEYHPVTFVGAHDVTDSDPSVSHHSGDSGGNWGGGHGSAIEQLRYITNNYSYVDNHDTNVDDSVHENVVNFGKLDQTFDNHQVLASGDGSVAAGHDINGDVATGDHSIAGNDNVGGDKTVIAHSFDGNNVATGNGVAGDGNQGNVTGASNSNVATDGGTIDNSTHDSHDKTVDVKDSGNTVNSDTVNSDNSTDSHDKTVTIEHHDTTVDSNNQVDHSQVSTNEQHGLINADISPNVDVSHNDLLSHDLNDLHL
jgi:hypothetical protein